MIKKIKFDSYGFKTFLKKIKMPYEKDNNLISGKPWKYRKEKNFYFKSLIEKNKIIGVIVYSKHVYNYHINFLYILSNKRNKNYGQKLLSYLKNLKKKKFLTTHIDKKLKLGIKFGKKNFSRIY